MSIMAFNLKRHITATKYYKEYVGMNEIDLKFNKGEIIGLFGLNGSGKTTTLKAISGLIDLTYGEITIDGKTLCSEGYND